MLTTSNGPPEEPSAADADADAAVVVVTVGKQSFADATLDEVVPDLI